jgi:hypothetical protein
MSGETLTIPRAAFDFEEMWSTPAECVPVRLRSAVDGAAPRLSTSVAVWYDEDYLSLLFSASDDHVLATMTGHDDPLWREDVVEVFLAPESRQRYFEIEVSPRGTVFDARIESPDGIRATMKTDLAWTCEGLFTAVRNALESDGTRTIDTLIRIPFFALERSMPGDGESWSANLYRIDRNPSSGDEFSAWQPTLKTPPDFHVPSAFGTFRFRG